MRIVTRPELLRLAGFMMVAVTYSTTSQASVIQPTVVLPPVSGAYTLGGTCVSALGRCTQNAMVSGFEILTSTMVGSDQLVAASAFYSADIFTDVGGAPGSFLGHLSIPGTAHFLYVGRNPAVNPLGTFLTELTDFNFSGMLNGNTFEVKRSAASTSGGSTTILQATIQPVTYEVSGSLEIFAPYSFNGSPFMPAPPRTADSESGPDAGPRAGDGPSCRRSSPRCPRVVAPAQVRRRPGATVVAPGQAADTVSPIRAPIPPCT